MKNKKLAEIVEVYDKSILKSCPNILAWLSSAQDQCRECVRFRQNNWPPEPRYVGETGWGGLQYFESATLQIGPGTDWSLAVLKIK